MTIKTKPTTTSKSETAVEPRTRKAQPGLPVPNPSSGPDLEARIKTRRAQVIAELVELRASARLDAAEAGDKRKAKLSQLGHIIKEDVADGWTSLGDTATRKLEGWLAESELPLPGQDAPAVTAEHATGTRGRAQS